MPRLGDAHLRASPSELIIKSFRQLATIGLAVRGLYGEGTEAMGKPFSDLESTTLGEKEAEIINRLSQVIETIIEKEHDAASNPCSRKAEYAFVTDRSRLWSFDLTRTQCRRRKRLNLLSVIKLGMDLGAFPEDQRLQIDELFIETQPAHLQKKSSQQS